MLHYLSLMATYEIHSFINNGFQWMALSHVGFL